MASRLPHKQGLKASHSVERLHLKRGPHEDHHMLHVGGCSEQEWTRLPGGNSACFMLDAVTQIGV